MHLITGRRIAEAVAQFAVIAIVGVSIFITGDELMLLVAAAASPVAVLLVIYRTAPGGLTWRVLPVAVCSALVATALWVSATDRFLNEIRESEEPPQSIARQAAGTAPWCGVVVGMGWMMSSLAKWDRGVRRDLDAEQDEDE